MRYEDTQINITDKIKANFLFKGVVGQDGVIFGDLLFRFETNAVCTVYSINEKKQISQFTLDKVDVLRPHSNAVFFGNERFAEGDEFPLLYCNIYNNYSNDPDRKEGMCCVYRLTRKDTSFETKLVQVLKIGFTEDLTLWKSLPDNGDRRPYGNFVIDVSKDRLYAYVMRDKYDTTRYFEFRIPKFSEGVVCERCGAKVVTLSTDDIICYFDTPYHKIIQGVCAYNGKIFSVEGGTVKDPNPKFPPRMRIIDTDKKCQVADIDLIAPGLTIEPELVDFEGDIFYYMDSAGNVYTIDFV